MTMLIDITDCDVLDAIESGDELDLMVFEAIGLGDDDKPVPMYSFDWNAAISAAEDYGMFDAGTDDDFYLSIGKDEGQWVVCDNDGDVAGIDDNGPAAICKAILWTWAKEHGIVFSNAYSD